MTRRKGGVDCRAAFRQCAAQQKQLETMRRLNRRSFISASAAVLARPAVGAVAPATAVDVAIIGAGAAGIAATRRIAAAGRKVVLLEASDRVGGRCVTDTISFGLPYDRGAHWIHTPDVMPRSSVEIYYAAPSQKVRYGRRYAREGELEDFLVLQARTTRAIADAARKGDVACEQALPKDLADWRPAIEFVLGPFVCGKELAQVSAVDFARSAGRSSDAFCRQGFGALVAALAQGLPIELLTPATAIDTRRGVTVDTPKGSVSARAAIVTASTNVLASGNIKFTPDPLRRQLDACVKLSLGSYDHVALEITGNALELDSDDLVFEKATGERTAALLGNVSGTPLCLVEIAGTFGRDLSAQGQAAMVDFAAEWLAGLYGADVKKAIKRSHATQWNRQPFALGAFSAAAPGGQSARRVLMEPVDNVLWFAGEAVHETLWGTVGGAWVSGERAADAVLRRFSGKTPAAEVEPPPKLPPKRESEEPSARRRLEGPRGSFSNDY